MTKGELNNSELMPMPRRIRGVYFLIQDQTIVYVGQSIDVVPRVHSHLNDSLYKGHKWFQGERKQFDSWRVIELAESINLKDEERKYIDLFNPKYNVDSHTKRLRKLKKAA